MERHELEMGTMRKATSKLGAPWNSVTQEKGRMFNVDWAHNPKVETPVVSETLNI